MKYGFYLIFWLVFLSSASILKKDKHVFIYGFENEKSIQTNQLENTIKILEKRLDEFGVNYEVKGHEENKIKVLIKANELDDERINELILNQGKFEFLELYKGDNVRAFVTKLYSILPDKEIDNREKDNPLVDLITFDTYKESPVLFLVKEQDTGAVFTLLKRKEVKLYLDSKFTHAKFLWGIPNSNNYIPLYCAKSNKEETSITEASIKKASVSFGYRGMPNVLINMNNEAALRWEQMTGDAYENRTNIAITVNDIVYSAPLVASGPIKGGKSEISGDFTLKEAQDLAVILSSQKSIPKLKLLNYSKILK